MAIVQVELHNVTVFHSFCQGLAYEGVLWLFTAVGNQNQRVTQRVENLRPFSSFSSSDFCPLLPPHRSIPLLSACCSARSRCTTTTSSTTVLRAYCCNAQHHLLCHHSRSVTSSPNPLSAPLVCPVLVTVPHGVAARFSFLWSAHAAVESLLRTNVNACHNAFLASYWNCCRPS